MAPRTHAKIAEGAEMYAGLVWYERSTSRSVEEYRAEGTPEDIIAGMLRNRARIERDHADDLASMRSYPDRRYSYNLGALAALRWAAGWELADGLLDT